jgi:hypothetical protein
MSKSPSPCHPPTRTDCSLTTTRETARQAHADANNDGNLQGTDDPENHYDTIYHVPLTNVSAIVDYNSVTHDIIVNVRIFIYTKDGTMLHIRIDQIS